MTMIMINIFEAKAKLSEYLEAVARGEQVVICNRNRPVAELRPVAIARQKRHLGVAKGTVTVPQSFFEPLPDDLLGAFEGDAPRADRASKIAEARSAYSSKQRKRK